MPVPFSVASFALAFSSGVAREKAESFISRLKQWQKMGFPDGINVGRGARAEYGATQLYQLAFMLKLMRVGLPPQRAQFVIRTAWSQIREGILETTRSLAANEDHLYYLMLNIDALSELQGADHLHVFATVFTSDDIHDAFADVPDDTPKDQRLEMQSFDLFVKDRLAASIIIEINSTLILLWTALKAAKISGETFADEMTDWHEKSESERAEFEKSEPPTETELEMAINRHQSGLNAGAFARAVLSRTGTQ